jgi:hypothetical protein
MMEMDEEKMDIDEMTSGSMNRMMAAKATGWMKPPIVSSSGSINLS